MYAVIHAGGKQYRVSEGQVLDVERLGAVGDEVALTPVLVVDGDRLLAGPTELSDVTVAARIVGETKGPKIRGFTYKAKTRSRRRWGHRQQYTTIEITAIRTGAAAPAAAAPAETTTEG